MARVNCGINPKYLSDQHLIAESVEITMITGSFRKNGYRIKSPIPDKFGLGTGHINFFKPKIIYLRNRLVEVNAELTARGFNPSTKIDVTEFSYNCRNYFRIDDWHPQMSDSSIVRRRVYERLLQPLRAKPGFHKFYKSPIEDIQKFANEMLHSPLYHV